MANHCSGRQANLTFTYAQNHTAIEAILSFVRTPTNHIKFTAERSPFAPMVKLGRKDVAAGDARRDPAVAEVIVESGMGALIAGLAVKSVVTGPAPSDDNQHGLLLANGWPYDEAGGGLPALPRSFLSGRSSGIGAPVLHPKRHGTAPGAMTLGRIGTIAPGTEL